MKLLVEIAVTLAVFVSIFLALYFYAKAKKEAKNAGATPAGATASKEKKQVIAGFLDKWWTTHPWVPIFIAILMINATVWMLQPTWWFEHWRDYWKYYLLLHLFLIAGLTMLGIASSKSKLKVGIILILGVVLCGAAFLDIYPFYMVREDWQMAHKSSEPKAQFSNSSNLPVSSGFYWDSERQESQLAVNQFWYTEGSKMGLTMDEAREMVNISYCESGGFHHLDRNGNVLSVANPGDRGNDVGIMGINDKTWAGEAKKLGLDITKREDNLKMALHIRTNPKTRGAQEWSCRKNIHEQVVDTVEVPVEGQSKVIPVIKNCHGVPTGRMKVTTDRGEVFLVSLTEHAEFVAESYTSTSATGKPEMVNIVCSDL